MIECKRCICANHEGCNQLPINNFGIHRGMPDGLNYYCKKCVSTRSNHWRTINPEAQKISSAKTNAKRYKENGELIRNRNNQHYQKTKQERHKEYIANIEKYRQAQARSRKIRKENGKASQAERRRCATDINYRLSQLGRRRRLYAVTVQGVKKPMKYIESLGCSVSEFRKHIESLFLPGMNWDNQGSGTGRWHIDEIKPCASFDLSDIEQYIECFNYKNSQPLWAIDNMKKSSIFNGVRHINKKVSA